MQPTMQQLDIFADSRDVMLRNDVLEPLQRREAAAARTALERLAGEYPDDGALPAQTVQSWLAPSWRALARRAASLPFRGADAGDHALNHAAPLWLLAGDGAAAIDAVEGIASWWRIPAPLAWMTEARYRTDGLDAAWPLLAELAWLAPARFAVLLPVLGDASLDALRRRFDAEFPGTGEVYDYAWFAAWLTLVKPALAGRLGAARVQRDQTASRATALLGEILRREHEGDQHELVTLRQEFSRLHAPLFEVYMATRKVQHR